MPSTLDELLALERALGAQIEAIGERCVSLWGKGGASLSCRCGKWDNDGLYRRPSHEYDDCLEGGTKASPF